MSAVVPSETVKPVEDVPKQRRVLCGCFGANRFGILVLSALHLSILLSCVIAYNATFVAMMDLTTSPIYNHSLSLEEQAHIDFTSSALPLGDRRFHFTPLQKSLSFAGAFCGALVGTQPINWLILRYGPHKVMTVIGAISCVLVGLTPIVVAASFPVFIVLRFFAGMAMSNLFPVAGIVVNQWAAVDEKGIFVAILSGHIEISPIFTMPISGLLAVAVSWPVVFYVHCALMGVMTVLWAVYYRDLAEIHPFVGHREFSRISLGKVVPVKGRKDKLPLKRIVRSITIWAVWVAVIGNFFVAQFTITFSPMYLAYVLRYSTMEAGFVTLIPLVFLLIIKFITGRVSDKLTIISEVAKLRLFNSLALLGSAVFFIVITFFPPHYNIGDTILIVIPVALLGFTSGGYPKCAVMVSKQYSPFVMSIVQMCAMGTLMIGSFVVPAMTTHNTYEEWSNVFALYAILLVVSNTIFVCFAKADPCKWTFDGLPLEADGTTVKEETADDRQLDIEGQSTGSSTPPPTIIGNGTERPRVVFTD